MTWLDQPEEQKRILMDLDVMAEHRSPHIVLCYGSAIWNVSEQFIRRVDRISDQCQTLWPVTGCVCL